MKTQFAKCSIYGKLILFVSLLIAAPLMMLPFYPEDIRYASDFLIPASLIFLLGLMICFLTMKEKQEKVERYNLQSGSITVLFIWLFGVVAGALPFVYSEQLSFVQALFEAVSGWTTTGLSVMDVSITPHIFLFHRGFMQFCGGLGFILMMVMFVQGKEAMSLYNAEGHPDKLAPNLGKTARTIFVMYISFLGLGTMVYIGFGMDPFDSLIHAMCALSTGGFSNEVDSIGAYNSVAIEAITIILMLIGTTNFAVLLLAAKGKFRQLVKVSELRFMFVVIGITTPLVAAALFFAFYRNVGESIRMALFNVVSALSTTGFSTMYYTEWPEFSIGMMILLMLIGGGIGSTAGGLKLTRVYLMLRSVKENIKRRVSPQRYVGKPYYYRAQGKTYIDENVERDTSGFIACYLLIFITGSLLLTLTADCSLRDAMFEFASSLGTVGLSIGLTGPSTNAATLIVEMVGMLMGRLEIFIVIIGIYSGIGQLKQYVVRRRA